MKAQDCFSVSSGKRFPRTIEISARRSMPRWRPVSAPRKKTAGRALGDSGWPVAREGSGPITANPEHSEILKRCRLVR